MTQKSFMSLMENDNDDESFNPKLSFELKCLLRCLIAVQMSEHSTTIRLFVSNQLLIGFCLFVTHNFSNFTFPFLYFYPIFFCNFWILPVYILLFSQWFIQKSIITVSIFFRYDEGRFLEKRIRQLISKLDSFWKWNFFSFDRYGSGGLFLSTESARIEQNRTFWHTFQVASSLRKKLFGRLVKYAQKIDFMIF